MAQERTRAPLWIRTSLRLAATRPGAWLLSRVLPAFEDLLPALSGGRLTLPRVMRASGAPVVELTTTGAKTGRERTVPVMGVRDGERWLVVASNWGRETHPAWYHNLRANPTVTLIRGDVTAEFVAREATGAERERCRERVAARNPGLATYEERAGDRDVPIVVLEPADTSDR